MQQYFLYHRLHEEENSVNLKGKKELWDMIKRKHTSKMLIFINASRQQQYGGMIPELEINVNEHGTKKYRQLKVEVVIIENSRNTFPLIYGNP